MRKTLLWIGGVVLVLIIVVFAAAYLIDEPLRRKMEHDINSRLKGYTVRVGKLDFHPIGLSLDLEDSTIYQNAHPDPPIAHIPSLHASVHWKAIIFGRLVADFQIDDPTLRIDLTQFTQEAKDPTPIKDKGWQDAVQAIYPLKINRFAISNADVTYIDKGPFKPLHLTKLNFVTENIRNVQSAKGTYPSPVQAEGMVFDSGKIKLDGNADFLAEPHIAFKAQLQLDNITLDYFKPITERYHLSVRKGVASTQGSIEYAADGTMLIINDLTLRGADVDYIHVMTKTAPTEKIAKEVGKTTREVSNKPSFEVKVDRVNVTGSRIGYVNQAAKPAYHVFFSDTHLEIQNLSNHLKDGVARARMKAKFMGSGPAQLEAAFRPETKGPDFNLALSIEDTDLRTMNDLLRAYGNFDVVAGVFSFFSEVKVRQGKIDGYVKPLFRELDVYDRRQDQEKSLFRKMYEGLVGGIAGLLQNRPRQEVATTVPVAGDIESPQTSTWETVINLIQNAFFKAILPGFEKEVSQGKSGRARTSSS
ncbi:MAG TPA: DUF748 domain-containing protein [Candidatus Udaeobacter sp.]|nr:DUF748 domain-containing protein [Candidatus Udaeobacter sp.]